MLCVLAESGEYIGGGGAVYLGIDADLTYYTYTTVALTNCIMASNAAPGLCLE